MSNDGNLFTRPVRRWLDTTLETMGYSKASYESQILGDAMGPDPDNQLRDNWERFLRGQTTAESGEKMAYGSSWFFSDVEAITKIGAQSTFHLWTTDDSGNEFIDTKHPLEKILARPNRFMGGSFLRRYTLTWLLVRGEAYWLIVPDKAGKVSEIWPLPANKVEPIKDRRKYIKGYQYTLDSDGAEPEQKIKLPVDRIVYFREPSIFNYHRGRSRIQPLRVPLATDLLAQAWNKDTFGNEATVRTLISTPENVNPTIFKRVKAELERELIQRGKRYIIARAGSVDVKQIGSTPKDMEYLAGRKFTRDEIDRIMGLPGGFWSESATEANVKVAKEVVVEITVWPILEMMVEELNAQLLDVWYPDDAETYDVRARDIRPKNIQLELEQDARMYEMMTINEVRKTKGLPPHETDYGKLPWGLRATEQVVPLFIPELAQMQSEQPGGSPTVGQNVTKQKPHQTPVRSKDPKPVKPIETEPTTREVKKAAIALAKDDLGKWRTVAKKSIDRGLEFESDHLPGDVQKAIRLELKACQSREDVTRLFDDYSTILD